MKIRLLTAHTAVKEYAYCCMKSRPDIKEYQVFVHFLSSDPTLSEQCWIGLLQNHILLHTCVLSKDYKLFQDGTQSIAIGSVVLPYLYEVRPIILQSSALDTTPTKFRHGNPYTQNNKEMNSLDTNTSGCIMVQLGIQDFSFL